MVWKIGDTAWIYLFNHRGELTQGKIVHVFTLPDWLHKHYVVELEVGGPDPLLEVRSHINMWRGPVGSREEKDEELEGYTKTTSATPQQLSRSVKRLKKRKAELKRAFARKKRKPAPPRT